MERPLFSDMLADRRRQLGYSTRQASRVLRLREEVLVAFEEGDFEHMPKTGYAQGMLSSYARYLGLDPNEVVDTYAKDFEDWQKGSKRRSTSERKRRGTEGRMGADQPYVGSRGLLPTSGGPAGDMGSFATTRVTTRGSDYVDDDESNQEYARERRYTSRVPSSTRQTRRTERTRARGSIETLAVDEYDDDLRLGRNARQFERASSQRGRRSSRNIASSERPRVRRNSGQSRPERGNASRGEREGARRRSGGRGATDSSRITILVVVGVILLLSLILIFCVTSCVGNGSEEGHTVPVQEATETNDTSKEADKTEQESTADELDEPSADSQDQEDQTQEDAKAASKETSVSVKVDDGAVTWLEVDCDGKSDVAETVTGPWQRTYTVEDAITIQAGDTTAVSVIQNGRQVQFESMASGIGRIRIQGTKVKKSSNKDADVTADDGDQGTTAHLGNATNDAQQQEGEEGESSDSAYDYQDEYDYDNQYGDDYESYDYDYQ